MIASLTTVLLFLCSAVAGPALLQSRELEAFADEPSVADFSNALQAAVQNLEEATPHERGRLLATRAIVLQLGLDGVAASEAEVERMWVGACRGYEPACAAALRWTDRAAIARDLGKRCREGDGLGCLARGWNADDDAATWFRVACDLGSARGCWELAVPRLDDPLGPQPALLRAACLEGWPAACRALGAYHEGAVRPDLPLAAVLYRTACDLYDPAACVALGRMYERGRGVDADERFAGSLYGNSCTDGSASGCLALGKLHETGRGADLSLDSAEHFYARSCELGDGEGCLRHGGLRAEVKEGAQARSSWDRGCELRNATACLRVAQLTDPSQGPQPDPMAQVDALAGACEAGMATICLDAGRRLVAGQWVRRDPERGVRLMLVGCRAGEQRACQAAARTLARGKVAGVDATELAIELDRQCSLGVRKSCALSRKLAAEDDPT